MEVRATGRTPEAVASDIQDLLDRRDADSWDLTHVQPIIYKTLTTRYLLLFFAKREGGDAMSDDANVHLTMHRLHALDTCVISDALDSLGLAGVADGLAPLWQDAELAGRVMTVALREASTGSAQTRHLGVVAIETAGPGDVIVLDNEGSVGMGAWGGLLTVVALLRGVAGVVIDGACRDVDEIRTHGFPAFARSGAMRTARGRVGEVAWGEPVRICNVEVRRGDFVRADGSGVIFVRAEDVDEVLDAAEALVANEKLMLADLRANRSLSEVLGGNYETMLISEPVR